MRVYQRYKGKGMTNKVSLIGFYTRPNKNLVLL